MLTRNKLKNQKAFTLIELLVVISILSLLSSIIFSRVRLVRDKARDSARIQNLQTVQKAIELYYNDHGDYPRNDRSSQHGSISIIALNELKPYISKLPQAGPQDPDVLYDYVVWPNDDVLNYTLGFNSVLLQGGYYLRVNIKIPNTQTSKDGGLSDNSYELFGGNYKIVIKPAPLPPWCPPLCF